MKNMKTDTMSAIRVIRRNKSFCRAVASVSAMMFLLISASPAFADSTSVLGGNAELTGMTRATLDVNGANAAVFSSSSASAVLDWAKFNVGSGQSMSFNGASTTFFNLVDGAAGRSQIDGMINGSGNVWVINPAGIAFGANATVNVDGLFAAAAGNISNADDLRNGTATMPAFDSFAGTVDAKKGSFAAEQVVLMGKTVTVGGGNFSGAKDLSIAASTGAMTVDEVEGGKVSVNIADFAADDAAVLVGNLAVDGDLSIRSTGVIGNVGDVSLSGNDVEIGGVLQSTEGGVSVAASGHIDVDANVYASGAVVMSTENGNITVERDRTVASVGAYGNVTLATGAAANGSGDVVVDGEVCALGDYGVVSVMSAQGPGSTGSVVVNGIVDSDYETTLGAGYAVSGAVTGGRGAVTVGSKGVVASEYGTTYLVASGQGESGVSVNGAAQGSYGLVVMAGTGDVSINDGATVVAGLKSVNGGLAYPGMLSVSARAGDISVGKAEVLAGNASVTAQKDVSVNGFVDADQIAVQSVEGGVQVGGTLAAKGTASVEANNPSVAAVQVSAGGADAKVDVSETGVVLAKEGSVTLVGENGVSSSGSIAAMNGYVNVNGKAGDVNLNENGTGLVVAGAVQAVSTKDVIVNNPRNIISVGSDSCKSYSEYFGAQHADFKDDPTGLAVDDWTYNAYYSTFGFLSWGGNVVVCGDIAPNGLVAIQAQGDLTMLSGSSVQSAGAVVLDAGGDALIGGRIKSGGNVTIGANGDIVQSGFSGVVTPRGAVAKLTSSFGEVRMTGAANDFGGFVQAEGESVSISDSNDIVLGPVVARSGDVDVKSRTGSIVVAQGAETQAAGGEVSLRAADSVYNLGTVTASKLNATAMAGDVVSDVGSCVRVDDVAVKAGQSVQFLGSDIHVGERFEADGADVLAVGAEGLPLGNVTGTESVQVWTMTGDITVDKDAEVLSDGKITLMSANEPDSTGNVRIEGRIASSHGDVSLASRYDGDVIVSEDASVRAEAGELSLSAAGADGCIGDVTVDGEVFGEKSVMIGSGMGVGAKGDVTVGVSGTIAANGNVDIWGGGAGGDVVVNGSIASHGKDEGATVTIGTAFEEQSSGDIVINGSVTADDGAGDLGYVQLWSGVSPNSSGNVTFGRDGNVSADNLIDVIARNGNVRQDGDELNTRNGYAPSVSLHSALTAPFVEFNVNGDIGTDDGNYVSVDGVVLGYASGNASIAAADGGPFLGGDNDSGHKPTLFRNGEGITVDWGSSVPNSTLVADGNLSIYSAQGLDPYGLLVAGRNLTVSAASFGDMNYLQAGGTLTINNVGKPAHPEIAYFESVDGKEPKINNQPNDTVIFVDGRLAGGNMQVINTFGATEAFPVDTPELKSEQGIFGNPVFMHGDLDVANPMAVGNVDYMLQEIPRLTLASDFPLEIDKSVNTAGLNPKDVYRFGQHPQVADEKPQADEDEKKKDDKASSEQPAEPKVASL